MAARVARELPGGQQAAVAVQDGCAVSVGVGVDPADHGCGTGGRAVLGPAGTSQCLCSHVGDLSQQ